MPLSIIYFIILNSLAQQESHVDLYMNTAQTVTTSGSLNFTVLDDNAWAVIVSLDVY